MERSTMLLIGKPSINGPSPMAMVNNQRVYKVIASSNTFEGLSKGLFDSCGVSRRVLGTSGNHRPFSRITLGHSPGSSRFVFSFHMCNWCCSKRGLHFINQQQWILKDGWISYIICLVSQLGCPDAHPRSCSTYFVVNVGSIQSVWWLISLCWWSTVRKILGLTFLNRMATC